MELITFSGNKKEHLARPVMDAVCLCSISLTVLVWPQLDKYRLKMSTAYFITVVHVCTLNVYVCVYVCIPILAKLWVSH